MALSVYLKPVVSTKTGIPALDMVDGEGKPVSFAQLEGKVFRAQGCISDYNGVATLTLYLVETEVTGGP